MLIYMLSRKLRKKEWGIFWYGDCVVIHSGKKTGGRTNKGVGLTVHTKYTIAKTKSKYASGRILVSNIKLQNSVICIILVYAPEKGKSAHGKDMFYKDLQDIFSRINNKEKIILMRDLNAWIGNHVVSGIVQKFNEETRNDNGGCFFFK